MLLANTNTNEDNLQQHVSSIRQLKTNYLLMKKRYFLSALTVLALNLIVHAQNPIVPQGMYIADPEAHVWKDGKIYIYGSRDESDEYWCSYKHHVLMSDDLSHWTIVENAFASKGENDEVSYCDHLLFAPDCAYKDGTYYLYYCSPDKKMYTEGVASSNSPFGPFKNGKHLVGANEIDPAVLVDKDGQAYFLFGQGKPKMAKLKSTMTELDLSTLTFPLDSAGNVAFHEGSSIRRIGDLYYLVFADDSRENRPSCLGYAISKNPMGPYTYKGVIIDNIGSDPACWNNHGSIEQFNGQWYVFYHRPTNHSQKFRKACIEPIKILQDGTIPEVEMTTQGALGHAIDAAEVMQAERACYLSGKVYIKTLPTSDIVNEGLTDIADGDYAAYKYLHFSEKQNEFQVKTSGTKSGTIEIRIDSPNGKLIGNCKVEPAKNYSITSCPINKLDGDHAIYLVFKGEGDHLFDVDWFVFK